MAFDVTRYFDYAPRPQVRVLGEGVDGLDVGHADAVADGQAGQAVAGLKLKAI